jgi:uncharacterized protein involved in response to NO
VSRVPPEPWTNDFYAAVVTVASVTIFTKFMTHRSREDQQPDRRPLFWFVVHAICIAASLGATCVALWGLYKRREGLEIFSIGVLGVALVILIIDGLLVDLRRRHSSTAAKSIAG